MVFGSIAAHDQEAITVFQIHVVIGHCAAPERLCQSRNSGAVSNPGLMVQINDAQGPHHRVQAPDFFHVDVGAAEVCNGLRSVNHLTFGVFLDKGGVTRSLGPLGDFSDGPVPAFLLPFVTEGGPVKDLGQPVRVGRCGLKD